MPGKPLPCRRSTKRSFPKAMEESDIRSFYQYIVSLGEPGDPAPEYVPPGQEPKTPYIVIAPPIMPKG